MKLRFRDNTLRLRVNRQEVCTLVSGESLQERVTFPGDAQFAYLLLPSREAVPGASFEKGVIRVNAPLSDLRSWAKGETVGLYFDLPVNGSTLKVAIEKDLECLDGPVEEKDPHAFSRAGKNC